MKTLLIVSLSLVGAAAGETTPAPPDLSWLTGSWRCEIWGGVGEEVYGQPNSHGIFGSFRFTKDGKVAFYEMLVIENHPTGTLLRMKHFHFGLKGWEEKNDFVEGKLIASGHKSLVFFGVDESPQSLPKKMWIKYRLLEDGSLETRLVREFPNKKAANRTDLVQKTEDVFLYRRSK